ncbi:MAG TPA: amino acid ABC transporter substrate-binding protein [Acidimicrobiia bacterium]|nr:amino acid ABC transporter substrate-binding protein [Acidimicrobiia bacterium]
MRHRTLLAVLTVFAMVLAACGDGGEGSDTTQPEETATTAAEETPTTEASEEPTTTAGEVAEAPEAIRIGAVVPLTGAFAGGGAQIQRGYVYAVDAINEAGGVMVEEFGTALPLELDLRDDASDPNQTTSIMDELAGSDIVAYLGGFATPVHAAGSATAERNGIPYLGAATSTQALHEQGYRYFFSPFPKSPDMAVTVFEMLNGLIPEGDRPLNVGIFQEATDWGEELGPLFVQEAESHGYEVVYHETYAPGTTDYTDLILGAQAAGVEALLSLPTPPDGFAIYQQMGELGWKPPFNLVIRAADVPTWNDLGAAGEGVVLSTPWHPALGFPGTEAVNERHLEEEGRPADPVVGSAYALIEILADAIERAGTLDHDAVRDAIAATDGLETIIGPITFREDGTAPVPNPQMQRIGGAIELIWPAESATSELVYPAP